MAHIHPAMLTTIIRFMAPPLKGNPNFLKPLGSYVIRLSLSLQNPDPTQTKSPDLRRVIGTGKAGA